MTTQIKAGVIAANAVNSSELASGALSGQNFTGDVTFDTTTLFVDSTNNRVGIKTTSPSNTLDVVGGFNLSGNLFVDTNVLATDVANNRVGIGTTSPTQKLDINGSIAVGYDSNSTHQILKGYATNHDSSNQGGILQLGIYDGSFTGIKVVNTASSATNYNSQYISFETHEGAVSVAERMRITPTGNVGIGTINPTAKLHVEDTSGDDLGFYVFKNGRTSAKNYSSSDMSASSISWIQAQENNTSLANTLVMRQYDAAVAISALYNSTNTGSLAFGTNNGSASVVEHMRITSAGNVGIGTSSPQYKFDVYGTDDITMRIHRPSSGLAATDTCGIGFSQRGDTTTSSSDTRAGIFSTYNGDLFLAVEAGGNLNSNPMDHSALFIEGSDGSVGIGTTSPVEKLHVEGSMLLDAYNVGAEEGLFLRQGFSSSNKYNLGIMTYAHNGSTNDGLTIGAYNGFSVCTGSNSRQERMRIDNGGALHIGTQAQPGGGWDAHLNVAHDANAAYFRSTGSGGSAGVGIQVGTYTATTYALVFYNGQQGSAGGVSLANANTSTSVAYNTSSDYRMKENIRPLENGLDRLKQLKPVKFDWKTNDETSEGFIAHEVQEIFPDAIAGEKDGEEMQGMDYGRITPLLVKAIQEQQTIIDDLKSRLDEAGL